MDEELPIIVVCATPDARGVFMETSHLARTLPNGCDLRLRSCNNIGLSTIYNQFLTEDYRDRTILFIHDDVAIQDNMLIRKLHLAHKRYDIVGLAGGDLAYWPANRQLVRTDQMMWHILSDKRSGIVAHFDMTHAGMGTVNSVCFGNTPAPVKVLDGLFISVNVTRLLDTGVKFDEQFDFHCYDLSFALRAGKAGLSMGTWPIFVIHEGTGASANSQSFTNNANKILADEFYQSTRR